MMQYAQALQAIEHHMSRLRDPQRVPQPAVLRHTTRNLEIGRTIQNKVGDVLINMLSSASIRVI